MRPRHSLGQFATGLLLVGLVTACVPASASPSGPASGAPPAASGSAPEATVPVADLGECQPLDLELPSGEPLDLTGSWLGDDLGPYEVRQFGDCLWWVGQNETYTYVLTGHLDPDFTIAGRWATIAASDRRIGTAVNYGYNWIGTGTIVLGMEFAGQGTNADVVLTKVASTQDEGFEPGYPIAVTTWTRVDDDPDHPIPAASPD